MDWNKERGHDYFEFLFLTIYVHPVLSGKPLSLQPGVVKGVPRPQLTWYRNGEIMDSIEGRYEVDPITGRLLFVNLDTYDAGFYTLRAENEAGDSEAELQLTVWEAPQISLERETYFLTAGQEFTIEAKVHGKPEPRLSWSQSSIRITSNGRRLTQGHKLIFSSVQPSDGGNYAVMASNAAGVVTHRFEVVVNEKPNFEIKPPMTQSVPVGEQLKLICSAKGHPMPHVTWIREDRFGYSDITVDSSQAGLAILTIEKVSQADTGAYVCSAENDVGSTTAMTMVNVDMPPKIFAKGQFNEEKETASPVGRDVIFDCHATGDPQPTYTWTHNGQVVSQSQHYQIFNNGTLKIVDLVVEDAGTVRCTAHNHLGLESVDFELIVQQAPAIESEIGPHRVEFGNFIEIKCSLVRTYPPAEINWQLGQRQLSEGRNENGRIIVDDTRLIITAAKLEDTGVVSCLASNEIGVVGSAGELTVYRNAYWSQWSAFEACSATCGDGVSVRRRACVGAVNGGDDCPANDEAEETTVCHIASCPVDGQLTGWSNWSECSVSCGRGVITRTRDCQSPLYGGSPCIGDVFEDAPCQVGDCDTDGNWSRWGSWESCDKTCGGGIRIRRRACDNPAPTGLGFPCAGSDIESRRCALEMCPLDGDWGSWLSWSICSKSCGGGERIRSRYCDDPEPQNGGMICSGSAQQVDECNAESCPIDGAWLEWAPWSECSRSCDGGIMKRSRVCQAPLRGGMYCAGHGDETARCSTEPCPLNGAWGTWSSWSSCSVTCGHGLKTRLRNCDSPPPVNGGLECQGIGIQRTHCHLPCKSSLPKKIIGKFL